MTNQQKPDRDDEQHRLFREALARKKAQRNDAHAAGVANKGVSEAHNDKQARQFRRKDGASG